jgi:hypothetical protein
MHPHLHYYKRFVKFFYDYVDDQTIEDCLKLAEREQTSRNHVTTKTCPLQRSYTSASLLESGTSIELISRPTSRFSVALFTYLAKLCTNPRSLQSLSRRIVFKQIQKPTSKSIKQLPIPDRLKDFLMFNELDH